MSSSWTWLTRVDRDDFFQTQSVFLRTEPTGRLRSVKVIILSHVPAVPGCSDAGAGNTEGTILWLVTLRGPCFVCVYKYPVRVCLQLRASVRERGCMCVCTGSAVDIRE